MHGESSSSSRGPRVPHDPTGMPDGEPVPPVTTGMGLGWLGIEEVREGPLTLLQSFGPGCQPLSRDRTLNDSKKFRDRPTKEEEERGKELPLQCLPLMVSSRSIRNDSRACILGRA